MNRPYRDDEEKVLNRLQKLLTNINYDVAIGRLEAASVLFCEADQALDKLCEMVRQFDEDEALEAEDE